MRHRLAIALVFGFLLSSAATEANEAAGRAFFENRIRPVLVEHCYECHSASSEKLGGKLFLDSKPGWEKGGESGAAIRSGDPEASLLLDALRWEHDLEMPPEEPLPETVVNDFVRWIEMGAPDPRTGETQQVAGKAYDAEALWSFQPLQNSELPGVLDKAWPRSPLDHFVLAKMEALSLEPTRDARPETLIRRLYVDLIGLPPTRSEMDAALAVPLPQVVDELLASPHFGERWARHWLDVARYAESNGNDGLSRNPTFPHAWRYRDYVISAFNADTPYDRFLTEQIAGDLLPSDSPEERDRNLIATGFLALGAKPAKAMNNNFDMDVVADQIDVIGTGILGISIACARCHDHKFDPIPTKDYYALAGIFTSTETMWGLAGNEKLTAPPTDLHVLKAAKKVPPPADFVETVILRESNTGKPKAIPKPKWAPGTPLAMGARDKKEPADCKVNLKGDAKKLGDPVPRGVPEAFGIPAEEIAAGSSGRLELARWLTRDDHPQTARVMVNRIWQHLFGEGIVRTSDEFGVYGERPTHPELLDHLATRFQELDWSMKQLIREIVLSRTYQLSSEPTAGDPENRWLTRHHRRRMDAETLRDAMLLASGRLERQPADGSLIRHRDILVNLAGSSLHHPSHHRSIYLCYLRNSPPPELAAFDLPDFTKVQGQRDLNTVPGQALFLFNNPFVIEQARHLASCLSGADVETRIQGAFERVLHRSATETELASAMSLLGEVPDDESWAVFAQALLSANEFRYVD